MLLNHSGSYYEDYKRSKGAKGSVSKDASNERLLTDRSAYISFLEVQLERVSAACLTSQGFSERIEQVQAELIALREKSNNMSKTIAVTQGSCDAQTEQSSTNINEMNIKMKSLSAEVAECLNEISSARLTMAHVKKIPEEVQAQRKDDIDNLKHRLENTFTAAIGDRIDVMQARVHGTEAKVKDMDSIAKAETQSALDAMESKLRIAIDTVNEQAVARSRSVETKISADVQRLREDFDDRMTKLEELIKGSLQRRTESSSKGAPALTEKLRRDNRLLRKELDMLHQEVKEEMSSVDRSCKAMVSNVRLDLREEKESLLRELKEEVKVYLSKLTRNEAKPSVVQVKNERFRSSSSGIVAAKANAATRTTLEAKLDGAVDDERCSKGGTEGIECIDSNNATETATGSEEDRPKLDAALEAYLEKRLERLVSSQVARVSSSYEDAGKHNNPSKLDAVNGNLELQSTSVAESMKKIEEFMKLYGRTQKDLKASLKKGKQHQHNLNSLVERADTGIREAATRIDFDEAYSDEEDCYTRESRLLRRPRSTKRRTKISVRSKSADSFGQEQSSGRRTGGGKRGRGSVEFPDDEIFGINAKDGNVKYLASQLRASDRSPFLHRPPWNSCSKHPSRVEKKAAKESKPTTTTLLKKKTTRKGRKSRSKSSLLKDFEKLEKSRNMLQKLYNEMEEIS